MMEKKSGRRVGWVFLEIVLIFILGSEILSVFCHSQILLSFLIYLLMLLYLLSIHGNNIRQYCEESNIRYLRVPDIFLIIVFVIITRVIGEYVNAISEIFFKNHVSQALNMATDHIILAIIAISLLPAIVEESMFRGYVFHRLGNGRKAIIISALLFAVWHMNFNQMSYAFVIGILFAVIYRYTDNLAVTMLVHMLFNLWSVMEIVFSKSAFISKIEEWKIAGYKPINAIFYDDAGKFQSTTFIVGTVILLLTILCFAIVIAGISRRKEIPVREGETEHKNEFGIPFYLCMIICILIAVLTEFMG